MHSVSVRQLVMLLRRHVFAVSLILLVTAGVAVYVEHSKPTYAETATVVVETDEFEANQPLNTNIDYLFNSSLVATCQILVMHLTSRRATSNFAKRA